MNLRSGIVLATLALLPLAACSGATASTPSASVGSTAGTTPATSSASATAAAAAKSYRLSDVAKHNTQADCWAAVDGGVYNLTTWISRHPGGPDKIIPLCGTDATSAFETQHDSQERPNSQLATFKVGDLID